MSVVETNAETNAGARPANEATEAEAAAHVRGIFDNIAPTYDRLNHLLSFGLDRHWWRRTAHTFHATLADPQAQVLDICCGTGDQTAALLAERAAEAAPITALDFSHEMLARARTKYPTPHIVWVEADAMHMPFADNTFDLVTAAFGFRNLSNYAAALAEIHRVLRPGGHIGILEANQPSGLNGALYSLYFKRILPLVGGWLSGDRAAYRYLPASVARFPRPPQMLGMLAATGFDDAAWDRYLLGAAGLYRATK